MANTVSLEAEHFTTALTSTQASWLTGTTLADYQGSGYMQALPDLDQMFMSEVITDSPNLHYPIYFNEAGHYTVWARGQAPNASGDSLYVSLDGKLVENNPLETVTGFNTSQDGWQWANTEQTSDGTFRAASLPIVAHGLYTLTLTTCGRMVSS